MTRVDRYPPHDVEGKESISRMYISLSLVSTSHYFRNVTRAISNSSNANINRRLFRLFLERKVSKPSFLLRSRDSSIRRKGRNAFTGPRLSEGEEKRNRRSRRRVVNDYREADSPRAIRICNWFRAG